MEGLKFIFMWCYTIIGSAVALAFIIVIINDPTKEITDYHIVQGKIQQSKHKNTKNESAQFKLGDKPDWFHIYLNRDQRHLFVKGSEVKVWFHKTLVGTNKVKQISVNGKLLWHYNYERQLRLQYKFLFVSVALIIGLLYMYRRFILKMIGLKT